MSQKKQGDLLLGGTVVVTGLLGCVVGAWALDHISASATDIAMRCSMAARICCTFMVLSLPCGIAAMWFPDSAIAFLIFTSGYLFMCTATTAPVVVGMMDAVPLHQRGIAMGLSSFGSHIFGDVLSPIVVGAIKDATDSLQAGMWLLVLWSVWPALFWGLAGRAKPRNGSTQRTLQVISATDSVGTGDGVRTTRASQQTH